MEAVTSIVVASHNPGKLVEIRAILADLPVEVLSADEALGDAPEVVEDGQSFEENAAKKARVIAQASGMITLADDSGLEVDALGGKPGVRSARFSGESATDAENNAALLEALAKVEGGERTARFRCVLVLVDPSKPEREQVVEGRCEGRIAREPRGRAGFGYDPLFIVAGRDRTMAELGEDEKNRISHRARALAQMRPRLDALVRARQAEPPTPRS